ncbi:MAG: PIN domain-containing protein [Saprospiraceae bacterium]
MLGNKYSENMTVFGGVFSMKKLEVVYPDMYTTDLYSKIFKQLRNKGNPIPSNDIWIAALTIQHSAQLLTYDKHFTFIDGLKLVPFTDTKSLEI